MTKSLFTKISLLACTFFAALPLSFGANNEYIDEKVENLGKLPCTGIELGKITGEYVKLPLITEKLISDAKSGDLEAQKKLFPYCISKEEQIYWLRRSAENGDASSQFGLHFRYKNGADNFPVSQEKSIFWAYKAALNDQINAQVDLAEYYYNKNDIEKAIKWYKRVANETRTSGSMAYPKAVATYTLGEIYLKNTDYDTAILYFTQCINHLNKISLPSKDEFFKTRIPPQEYIEKINGLRKNQTLNQKPQDSRTATDELLESLIKRANNNDFEAQFQLSRAYLNGENGAQKDFKEAEKWAKKAIANGDVKAHGLLGDIYLENKNLKEAFQHLLIAAEAGYSEAQLRLSAYYIDVKKDIQNGIKWAEKAAEQGDKEAIIDLFQYYATGNKNPKAAQKWLDKISFKDSSAEIEYMMHRSGYCTTEFHESGEEIAIMLSHKAIRQSTNQKLRELGLEILGYELENRKYSFKYQFPKDDERVLGNFMLIGGFISKKEKYSSSIQGVLKNLKNKNLHYISIEFAIFDINGNLLETSLDHSFYMEANGTWKFEATVFNKDAAFYKLLEIKGR